jgi:hypothetical protein
MPQQQTMILSPTSSSDRGKTCPLSIISTWHLKSYAHSSVYQLDQSFSGDTCKHNPIKPYNTGEKIVRELIQKRTQPIILEDSRLQEKPNLPTGANQTIEIDLRGQNFDINVQADADIY